MTTAERKPLSPQGMLIMQRALSLEPHTIAELAAVSGMSVRVVTRFLKDIRTNVHIAGYQRLEGKGKWPAQYAWGRKKDVEREQGYTAVERTRRSRARRRGEVV